MLNPVIITAHKMAVDTAWEMFFDYIQDNSQTIECGSEELVRQAMEIVSRSSNSSLHVELRYGSLLTIYNHRVFIRLNSYYESDSKHNVLTALSISVWPSEVDETTEVVDQQPGEIDIDIPF